MSSTSQNKDQYFFPALAVLMSAICFIGFSFTYFEPIIDGSYPPAKPALHLHGWSFFLWYLLVPFQAILITRGKHILHRTLGYISIMLVIVMTLTGLLVLSVRVDEATRNGAPEVWLLYGPLILSNLVLFVSFYSAAIYMAIKKHLSAHKRLIIVASAIALGAGFFRLILFLSGFHPLSLPAGTLGCSLFIVIGMAYDWFAHHKIHRVYLIGLIALLLLEISLLPQLNGETVDWINQGLASLGDQLGILYNPEPTVEF